MGIANPIRCYATPLHQWAWVRKYAIATKWIICRILLSNNFSTKISIWILKIGFIFFPGQFFPVLVKRFILPHAVDCAKWNFQLIWSCETSFWCSCLIWFRTTRSIARPLAMLQLRTDNWPWIAGPFMLFVSSDVTYLKLWRHWLRIVLEMAEIFSIFLLNELYCQALRFKKQFQVKFSVVFLLFFVLFSCNIWT